MSLASILDLPIARTQTALMQHLLQLVGPNGHRYWCGGTIPVTKLAQFAHKMAQRYPLLRNTRERSYDRQHGRAVVHMVVYPIGCRIGCTIDDARRAAVSTSPIVTNAREDGTPPGAPHVSNVHQVAWWLLSGPGTGGLADKTTPDAHVARDAMLSDSHIIVADEYVLLYATKKEPRSVVDGRTGRTRRILKDTSTGTWKVRTQVVREIHAAVDECCSRLEYGAEPGDGVVGRGLRGLLAAQRSRPLFSGVRTQVLDLHRYARDAWEGRRRLWLAAHPELAQRYGDAAGALLPIREVLAHDLPKMTRFRCTMIQRVGSATCSETGNSGLELCADGCV